MHVRGCDYAVVLFAFSLVSAQEEIILTECRTPSGEGGYCVKKQHCSHLRSVASYSKHRKCGEEADKTLCCEKDRVRYSPEEVTQQPPPALPRCVTPSGFKGHCIPYNKCPSAQAKTAKISILKEAICDHAKRHICCSTEETFDDVCGLQNDLTFRISGGTATLQDEFPWVVILKYKRRQIICGGTLVNSQFVITAGHCVLPDLEKIRISSNFNSNVSLDFLEFDVVKQKVHEGFLNRRPIRDDIALLKVKKVTYTESMKWICLPFAGTSLPNKFLVVGSGRTENGTISNLQLKGEFPLATTAQCENLYGNTNDYSKMICAGGIPGVDSCKGDSGGPLMAKDNSSRWRIYGIVSQGTADCTTGNLGLYTKVDDYIDWIYQNMRQML